MYSAYLLYVLCYNVVPFLLSFLKARFHVAKATLLPLLHKCWDSWPYIQFYPLDYSALCHLVFHSTVTVTES